MVTVGRVCAAVCSCVHSVPSVHYVYMMFLGYIRNSKTCYSRAHTSVTRVSNIS